MHLKLQLLVALVTLSLARGQGCNCGLGNGKDVCTKGNCAPMVVRPAPLPKVDLSLLLRPRIEVKQVQGLTPLKPLGDLCSCRRCVVTPALVPRPPCLGCPRPDPICLRGRGPAPRSPFESLEGTQSARMQSGSSPSALDLLLGPPRSPADLAAQPQSNSQFAAAGSGSDPSELFAGSESFGIAGSGPTELFGSTPGGLGLFRPGPGQTELVGAGSGAFGLTSQRSQLVGAGSGAFGLITDSSRPGAFGSQPTELVGAGSGAFGLTSQGSQFVGAGSGAFDLITDPSSPGAFGSQPIELVGAGSGAFGLTSQGSQLVGAGTGAYGLIRGGPQPSGLQGANPQDMSMSGSRPMLLQGANPQDMLMSVSRPMLQDGDTVITPTGNVPFDVAYGPQGLYGTPADPVSLSLALNEQKIATNAVEDRLSFGFRSLPKDVPIVIKKKDRPEENLYELKGAIVELKPVTASGRTPDEEALDDLLELEADIEADSLGATFRKPTLGEIGYGPAKIQPATFEVAEPGTLPPAPTRRPGSGGFLPGTVVVNPAGQREAPIPPPCDYDEDVAASPYNGGPKLPCLQY